MKKEYIGDGVYASFDGFQIWLTTLEGNEIALEPNVFSGLIRYRDSVYKIQAEPVQ